MANQIDEVINVMPEGDDLDLSNEDFSEVVDEQINSDYLFLSVYE